MKAIGLNNKVYTWKISNNKPSANPSKLHLKVRAFLKASFPFERVLEEVYLPGSGGLIADFVIVKHRLIIEAHGVQHYEQVEFFHSTIGKYNEALTRDLIKEQWAKVNRFRYVELPYYENECEWSFRLA